MADEPHEIFIVKHVSDHEHEGGHGAWKVAFADFMTAMMAFFLVMWLISANDKSKASIAKYFNPMKLVENTQNPKGVHTQASDKSGITTVDKRAKPIPEAKDQTAKANPNAKETTYTETALFQDPYSVLGAIAGETGIAKDQGAKAEKPEAGRGPGAAGMNGGDAYRDPFAPTNMPASTDDTSDDADLKPPQAPPPPAATPPAPAAAAPAPAAPVAAPTAALRGPAGKVSEQALKLAQAQLQAQAQAQTQAQAKVLATGAADIRTQLDKAMGADTTGPNEPKVTVEATDEGILISLTDDIHFEMFTSGSAVPDAKVVKMVAKLAQILKSRPGKIIIRGHTDAAPFATPADDNWRLSSARAHIAYYMLLRGGLDEKRVERIEGYADRHLKVPDKPLAPENRRIEILLKQEKT